MTPEAFRAASAAWYAGAPARLARARLLVQLCYLTLAEQDFRACPYCMPGQPCSRNHGSVSAFDPPARRWSDLSPEERADHAHLGELCRLAGDEARRLSPGEPHGEAFAFGEVYAAFDRMVAERDERLDVEAAVEVVIEAGGILLTPELSVGPYAVATDGPTVERFALLNLQGEPLQVSPPSASAWPRTHKASCGCAPCVDRVGWTAERAAALFVGAVGVDGARASVRERLLSGDLEDVVEASALRLIGGAA